MVGGTISFLTDKIQVIASIAPAAPNKRPVIDLVELILSLYACSPKTPNIAFVSSTSSIINGEKLSASPKNYLTKGKQVLMMKEVEGAVFQICNLRDIQQGLPFDNSHSIIILETYAKNHKAPNENLVWQKFCSLNINLCKNLIYYEEGYEIDKTYINSEKFKKIESLSEKSLTKLLLEILKETQNAK